MRWVVRINLCHTYKSLNGLELWPVELICKWFLLFLSLSVSLPVSLSPSLPLSDSLSAFSLDILPYHLVKCWNRATQTIADRIFDFLLHIMLDQILYPNPPLPPPPPILSVGFFHPHSSTNQSEGSFLLPNHYKAWSVLMEFQPSKKCIVKLMQLVEIGY